MQVADVDGDGRDEVLVEWEAIGANRLLNFGTLTEFAAGRFRTVDPLPLTYQPARPPAFKYYAFNVSNEHDPSEHFLVHGAWEYYAEDGALVVVVRSETPCNACASTFEVMRVVSTSHGSEFRPWVAKRSFVEPRDLLVGGSTQPRWQVVDEAIRRVTAEPAFR